MATLKDIAERAGVTVTTVSRVINQRGYASEETRRKVREVMKELHYQPNELARSLIKQRTNTIGLIVPHIIHPFFSRLISCIEEEASRRGYKLLLCNSREQPQKEADYIDMCVSNRVSAMILCSKYVQTERLHELNIPIINFEREETSGAITILCDDYQGGRMATEHLVDCGCKRLLHFGGIVGKSMPADSRAAAFSDVCVERRVDGKVLMSDDLAYGSMNYHSYIKTALENEYGVDGIFASSDLIAAQVIRVCVSMGILIPQRVKLVGFDDVMVSELTTPSISTIHQPVREMVKLSLDYIEKSLKGEIVPSRTVLPVTFVGRESA